MGAALVVLALLAVPAGAQDVQGLAQLPEPVDPQSWALPEWLTWDDYHEIPGVDWTAPENQAPKPIRAALILGDFVDRPFVVTEPQGSDIFAVDQDWADRVPGVDGPIVNPTVGGVTDPADFYNRLLITEPNEFNNFHTVNEYWLEDSYGLIGVDSTAFGPYTLEGKEHEYGIQGNASASQSCPEEDDCSRDLDTELIQASLADVTAGIAANGGEDYDFRWLLHAGYDESGTWQEFGEMMFPGPEAVTDRFGPPTPTPDTDAPNAAGTRYVDWTSWAAAEGIWSHAIPGVFSTQGESDGSSVFAHELSHIFGVLDNYNNPYGNPVRRSYSGPWDMLSRGAFNGPGGPHRRWQIPATEGGAMGSHHMLRNKVRLGFTPPHEIMQVNTATLATTGPVFADIWPRAYPLAPRTGDTGLHGVQIGLPQGDQSPSCTVATDHACDGGGYDNYTIEHVEQIGHDSFTHDSGVLIAKNKTAVDLAPFIWVIDAHPRDINDVTGVGRFEGREIHDFIRPDTGERAEISLGDYRQLADALFHAGTGEGVVSEYVDEHNRLHIYVLEKGQPDGQAVPTYRVAVRSLDGAGPLPRSVVAAPSSGGTANPGRVAVVTVTVTNTGLQSDLVRLTHETDAGWPTYTDHQVIELGAGEIRQVPVHVVLPADASGSATMTLTATSETDPDATSTATGQVNAVGPAADDPAGAPPSGGGTPETVPPATNDDGDGGEGGAGGDDGDGGDDGASSGEREITIDRIAGDDRVATAVALSHTAHPGGAEQVVLARADTFPDALAGAPLAGALDAPLLLTDGTSLSEATAEEIARLGAGAVTILGGPEAVSAEVDSELDAMGLAVRRVEGDDRYGTAAAIAEEVDGQRGPVYLASGEDFPDALSVAPLAAFLGRHVLLTRPTDLPDQTAAALRASGATDVVVVGGESAVGADVVSELEAEGHQVRRIAGATRYETSALIGAEALRSGMAAARTFLATGTAFPDALAAGPAVAADGGSLLLVNGGSLDHSPATERSLVDRADVLRAVRLVGGPAAVSSVVEGQIRERLDDAG